MLKQHKCIRFHHCNLFAFFITFQEVIKMLNENEDFFIAISSLEFIYSRSFRRFFSIFRVFCPFKGFLIFRLFCRFEGDFLVFFKIFRLFSTFFPLYNSFMTFLNIFFQPFQSSLTSPIFFVFFMIFLRLFLIFSQNFKIFLNFF